MGNVTRKRNIRLALNDAEHAEITELAHVRRQSISDMLRALVAAEAKKRGVTAAKKVKS